MVDNTRKVLALVQIIADTLKAVVADGKVDWQDLPRLVPILAKVKPALDGAQLVGDELKNMSDADIQLVVLDLTNIVSTLVNAFTKPTTTVQPNQIHQV